MIGLARSGEFPGRAGRGGITAKFSATRPAPASLHEMTKTQ